MASNEICCVTIERSFRYYTVALRDEKCFFLATLDHVCRDCFYVGMFFSSLGFFFSLSPSPIFRSSLWFCGPLDGVFA